jgi:hypothetical protein
MRIWEGIVIPHAGDRLQSDLVWPRAKKGRVQAWSGLHAVTSKWTGLPAPGSIDASLTHRVSSSSFPRRRSHGIAGSIESHGN